MIQANTEFNRITTHSTENELNVNHAQIKMLFFLLVTVRYYSILAYAKGSCVVLGDCTYLF